ncbi:MAG: hypothetical protein EBQ92_01155, partial [Proteobacteria bacterium]|nr:hypothetical protein [Pseudomonadota bacterium]
MSSVERFDGDEMNTFIPQSLQTQIELEEIACVEKQIITPTASKTIVGIVQDGLLGAYNMTSPTVRIDWKNAMNMMSYTSLEDFSKIKKNKEYSGSELYSLIMPPNINVDKSDLKIKNGQLIEGRLKKDVLGPKKKNNLIQLIWDGCGVNDTKDFIDNTQRLINNFNLWHGFSVGIGDVSVSKEVHDQIDTMFATKELKLEELITEMENNPDLMSQELFEYKLFSEMNGMRADVSKVVMSDLSETNGINIMATSGSKGDETNMGQMAGCLGLQAFEGKLIPKKYNGRTLAYFHQNDDRTTSRGLIRQSFSEGMQFPEFVFHLMAGRSGIIDGAIKSVTGDTQIVIQEEGNTKCVEIGKWIDELMDEYSEEIDHNNKHNQDLLKLKNKVYVPTCDQFGKTSWELMTDVTRHDPTEYLYKIKTYGGREVTVADSKSLLIWNNENKEFESVLSTKVNIGDCVPVTYSLPEPPVVRKYIDIGKYIDCERFEKVKYIDGEKYVFDTLEKYKKYEMTRENGFLVGLYACENLTKIISDKKIRNYITSQLNKFQEGSEMTHEFLKKIMKDIKCIPDEAFDAPDEFIIGLLDGYFSGDGHITRNSIVANSASKDLIEGISFLCSRLGIIGRITKTQMKENNLGTKNIAASHIITIRGQAGVKFRKLIKLTKEHKNNKLNECSFSEKYEFLEEQNEVILDKIINIEKIVADKDKYLYDVTVPSTKNFQIKNGL